MGVDKANLEFCGTTLLERALTTVAAACDEVAIVGDPAKFSDYGTVLPDKYPGCGPLAGIHAALLNSSAELNLMLAVDMPLVSQELLSFLLGTASETEAMVVVPRTRLGFQPLCAVYRRPFAAKAEKALRAGQYKIDAIFPEVRVHAIDEEELARAGFPEQMFVNVNTPEDLRMVRSAKT